MPRFHDIQTSFNVGEISDRLAARLDFKKYPSALETCENLIPLVEGGISRRPGTRYVGATKSSAVKGRLKPFQYSVTQAYILEMGANVIRAYRYQGAISVATTTAAVTNGTFTGGITGWTDSSTGTGAISHDATNNRLNLTPGGTTAGTDIAIATQSITTGTAGTEHVIKFKVIGAPGDSIEFQVGTTASASDILAAVTREVGYHCVAFTPSASPFYIQFRCLGEVRNKTVQIDDVSILSNQVVETDSPWPEADLFQVEGPQNADVLYLFHGSYPTHKIVRYGHTSWSIVEVAWKDGPYLEENATTTTMLPSAATGLGITLTLSSTDGVNDGQGWLSTDVGRLVRYKKTTTWGYAVITSITSTTVANADVRSDFEAAPTAVTTWRLGAWSGTTGYPKVGCFFEQRLYAANTDNDSQTFWATVTGDYEDHTPDNLAGTVTADRGLSFTLAADDVNVIRWMSAGEDDLAIGTAGGEWVPSSSGAAITPLDITCRRRTTRGSAAVMPVRVGQVVIFLQRAMRRLYEFAVSFDTQGYTSTDLTQLAYHMTRVTEPGIADGIVEMAYAKEPNSTIWAVRQDGKLLSLTYARSENVIGWARHIIGGSFQGGDAVVESIAIIPGANGSGQYQDSTSRDEVWMIVKRTINGADVRYIEFMEGEYETGRPQEDAYYADSLITADTPETISGATQANPVVLTITGTSLVNGDLIKNTEVKGMTELNGNVYQVANKATNTVELVDPADGVTTIDGTAFTAYISGGKSNALGTAISGLSHLEGETVKIWGDGGIIAPAVVASGAITSVSAISVAQVGLGYTHKIKTLKVSTGNPVGTALGKKKDIYALTLSLLNSHLASVGPDESNLNPISFRQINDPMDAAAPLFTGDYYLEFNSDWKNDPRIFIESDEPAPFTLLAIAPETDLKPLK